jgi:uncharacterized protein (TIGR00299 family) protein
MKVLYLDCRGGVSGDMVLAALVNLTDGRETLERGLKGLGLDCFGLSYPKRRRGGIEASGVLVEAEPDARRFDNLEAVLSFLDGADLSVDVRRRAAAVFRTLAEGEAVAHDVAAGYTHFHEVGAVDALVDVVGSSILLELIDPGKVMASPVRTGFGTTEAAHGTLPVPAPATAAMLEGVPVFTGEEEGEFATPTGAALVKTFVDGFGPMPEMVLGKVGYGPGSADPSGFPNALAAYVGETAEGGQERVAVIEANVDDMTGEALARAAGLLSEAGAFDVFTTPLYMKKGRPGVLLTVLGDPGEIDGLVELVLRHTSTFGVRYRVEERTVLPREVIEVETEYGVGKVKVGRLPDGAVKLHPEYDSVVELADGTGATFVEVYEALAVAAREKLR